MRKTILQFACILLLSAAPALLAQVSGTLAGKITNASGTAVPNAAITVTNATTGQAQKVLTGPDGGFSLSLPAGTYRIDVETQGYKHTTQQNITLVAGPPQTLTITLEAGPMTETVEIKGHAPDIQTVGGEVAMGIDTRTLLELPVIDRNYQQLVQLQTGITPPFPMGLIPPPVVPNWAVPATAFVVNPDRNRFFSTNGQPVWNNAWYTDGALNVEPFRNTALRVQPTPSVQQMNVETSELAVSRGFVGGGNVTAITPGGTNAFHGEVYEFWSGDDLLTRNFFDTGAVSSPRFDYNQPGVAGGGAINHDKTFLFGDYEGTYTDGDSTNLTTVPTAAELTGNFSAIPGLTLFNPATGAADGTGRLPFAGNIIPITSLNPTAVGIASLFPAANLPGNFNNLQANSLFRNHQTKADGRLDEHFNEHTSAFLRYGYTNDSTAQASPYGSVLGEGLGARLIAQNTVADVTHVFSNSLITDFRFAYNRWQQSFSNTATAALNPITGTSLGAGFGSGVFLPSINISGFSPIGTAPTLPEFAVDNTFDWVSSWSWNHGIHNIKFGTDIRRFRTDGFTDSLLGQQFGPNGTINFTPGATLSPTGPALGTNAPFNALAAYLVGAPTNFGALSNLTTPTIRQTLYSFWLGDTIQLFHHLSLDFGVRYELYGSVQPRNAGGAMYYNAGDNTFNFGGIGGVSMNPSVTDTDAVAPRFGFAYRINEKTVVRGGYGIQYFQPPYSLMGLTPTAFGSVVGAPSGFTVAAPFPTLFAGLTTPPVTTASALTNGLPAGNTPATLLQRNIETPYVQNYSLQVQREFYWGSMLSIGYVGNVDRQLPYNEELNAALPGTGVAGMPFFGPFGRTASTVYYSTGLTSNYNSLQVSLTKRMAKGVSFVAAYTYARALGYTNNQDTLLNPFNLQSNYGPLDFNRQSILNISWLWELPFGKTGGHLKSALLGGWQVNGIWTYQTSTPVSVFADPATCNCPGFTPFASLVGAPFLNSGLTVLNPASFAAPAPGTFGDLNRGAVGAPGFNNWNLSLFKNFRFHDRFNIQLRGEAYDLANSSHFAPEVGDINLPTFGQQTSTLTGFGRQVNIAFRLMF